MKLPVKLIRWLNEEGAVKERVPLSLSDDKSVPVALRVKSGLTDGSIYINLMLNNLDPEVVATSESFAALEKGFKNGFSSVTAVAHNWRLINHVLKAHYGFELEPPTVAALADGDEYTLEDLLSEFKSLLTSKRDDATADEMMGSSKLVPRRASIQLAPGYGQGYAKRASAVTFAPEALSATKATPQPRPQGYAAIRKSRPSVIRREVLRARNSGASETPLDYRTELNSSTFYASKNKPPPPPPTSSISRSRSPSPAPRFESDDGGLFLNLLLKADPKTLPIPDAARLLDALRSEGKGVAALLVSRPSEISLALNFFLILADRDRSLGLVGLADLIGDLREALNGATIKPSDPLRVWCSDLNLEKLLNWISCPNDEEEKQELALIIFVCHEKHWQNFMQEILPRLCDDRFAVVAQHLLEILTQFGESRAMLNKCIPFLQSASSALLIHGPPETLSSALGLLLACGNMDADGLDWAVGKVKKFLVTGRGSLNFQVQSLEGIAELLVRSRGVADAGELCFNEMPKIMSLCSEEVQKAALEGVLMPVCVGEGPRAVMAAWLLDGGWDLEKLIDWALRGPEGPARRTALLLTFFAHGAKRKEFSSSGLAAGVVEFYVTAAVSGEALCSSSALRAWEKALGILVSQFSTSKQFFPRVEGFIRSAIEIWVGELAAKNKRPETKKTEEPVNSKSPKSKRAPLSPSPTESIPVLPIPNFGPAWGVPEMLAVVGNILPFKTVIGEALIALVEAGKGRFPEIEKSAITILKKIGLEDQIRHDSSHEADKQEPSPKDDRVRFVQSPGQQGVLSGYVTPPTERAKEELDKLASVYSRTLLTRLAHQKK